MDNLELRTLYCIVGPSGSGKSTLEKNIRKEFDWLKSVESYTTRPQRFEGEPGHRFIGKQEFDKLKLIAYTKFDQYEYGVDSALLDDCDLYVIDKDGIEVLKQNYDRPMIVVGLRVDQETCRQRMLARGDDPSAVESRLEHDRQKFDGYLELCDVVIDANGDEMNILAQFIDRVAMFEYQDFTKGLDYVNETIV